MTQIDRCLQEYKTRFPVDWIETYKWADTTKWQEYYKNGITIINNFIEYCFISFSRSVISGEYLIKDTIQATLEKFSEIVENEYAPDDTIPFKKQLFIEYQKLDENLQITITKYRQLIYIITNKIDQEYHKYLVNAVATKGKHKTPSIFDALHVYVFDLYLLDHMLSYGAGDIQKLIIIHESLVNEEVKQSEEIQPVFRVLKDKCFFLIKKMVYFDGIAEYSIDFKIKHIDKGSIQADAFQNLDKYFEFFYKHEYAKNEPMVNIWEQNCFNRRATFGQMILLMKFYKDSKNTVERQIERLIEEFNELYNKRYSILAKRKFDKYALHTLKNYMYNCRLSFRISRNYNFESLCKDMNELEYIQASTHIKNFYPYRKAITFLLEDVKKDIGSRKCSESLLKEKFDLLSSYIPKLDEAISWCEEHRFYPVQNLYNECIKKDTGYNGVVFTASSFSRPIKYNDLRDELQKFKLEVSLLKNEISLQKERNNIEKLKSEIDASKKSNIEILGVFTAVITFLFGCVNFFSNDNNATQTISQQIFHIVCLGLILLLFVSVICICTMRKENEIRDYMKHPRFWLLGVSSIAYIILLFVLLINVNQVN